MEDNQLLTTDNNLVQQNDKVTLKKGYFYLSRTMTYSLIFIFPMLFIYEILVSLINESLTTGIRNGADVILKNLLFIFAGRYVPLIFTLIIFVGLAFAFFVERKKYEIKIKKKYFLFMLGESIIYGLLLGIVVGKITRIILPNLSYPNLVQNEMQQIGLGTKIVLSLGAGIYEELLFRVILVSMFFGLLKIFAKTWKNWIRYIISAIAAAFIFSAFHYIGAFGERFQLVSFTFRFVAGLVLNGLYLTRGFGIAVWTHAIYDIFVSLVMQ